VAVTTRPVFAASARWPADQIPDIALWAILILLAS